MLQYAIRFIHWKGRLHPRHMIANSAVRDHHSLWLSTRARGVDHICQVFGFDFAAGVLLTLLGKGLPNGAHTNHLDLRIEDWGLRIAGICFRYYIFD